MIKYILIIIIMFDLVSYSQVSQYWASRYNHTSNGSDEATDLAIDASGYVYVTGTSVAGFTLSDIVTIKYGLTGGQMWEQRYTGSGGNYPDKGRSIAIDPAGNIIVGGTSYGQNTRNDFVILKYSPSGSLIWENRITGPDGLDDDLNKLVVDASGNIYAAGESVGVSTHSDFLTVKLNSSGVIQWTKRYNYWNDDEDLTDLVIDNSGNIYITGFGNRPESGYGLDFITIKYNPSGIEQYIYNFNLGGNEQSASISVDQTGNAYICGTTDAYGTGTDFLTFSIGPSGNFRWFQRNTGSGINNDKAVGLVCDASGNVYVAGSKFQNVGNDIVVLKYNSSGQQQWEKVQPAGGDDNAVSIINDYSGNIVVTGYTNAFGTNYDYYTFSYNTSGVQLWEIRYNGPTGNNDIVKKVKADPQGGIYVTGRSEGIEWDYATVKYANITSVEPVSNELPAQYKLSQNYPNPFNPATNINFSLPVNSYVSLEIFDINGRVVSELVNELLNAGDYDISFDASSLSSGLYFCRLSAGSFTDTKKMILIK